MIACVIIVVLTLSNLGEQWPRQQPYILVDLARSLGLILVAILALAGLGRWPRLAGATLAVLVIGDLMQWGWNFNPIISTDYLYPANPITDRLQQATGLFRTLPLQTRSMIFGPNILSVFGLQEVGGYTPLITHTYHQLFWRISSDVNIRWVHAGGNMLIASQYQPIFDLFNVKYVLSQAALPFELVPDRSQPACETAVPLTEAAVTQTLTALNPGLNRLDVHIAEVDPAGDGALSFQLRRDTLDGDLIAESVVPLADLSPDSDYSFYFAPVADSRGWPFVWSASATGTISLCADRGGALTYAAYDTWLQLRDEAQGVRLYENLNVMPRAFMVDHAERVAPDHVIDRLLADDFDWRHSVLLTDALPADQTASLSNAPRRTSSQATVTNYQFNQLDVDVQAV